VAVVATTVVLAAVLVAVVIVVTVAVAVTVLTMAVVVLALTPLFNSSALYYTQCMIYLQTKCQTPKFIIAIEQNLN
jgi:hypothetical protein